MVDHDHQLQALMMLNLTDKDVKEISQSAAELQSELNRLANETLLQQKGQMQIMREIYKR